MFESYIKQLQQRAITAVDSGLNVLAQSIDAKSPVDTGNYIKGNKRKSAKVDGNKAIGEVYNDSDEAGQVEYGFSGKSVNRHKNRRAGGPVIYTGVGARVYSRTSFEKQDEVKNTLITKMKG